MAVVMLSVTALFYCLREPALPERQGKDRNRGQPLNYETQDNQHREFIIQGLTPTPGETPISQRKIEPGERRDTRGARSMREETGVRRNNADRNSDAPASGAELPWNPDTAQNGSSIPPMSDADLIAAFRKAIELGDSDMLSHCRRLLMDMETRAVALLRPLVHSGAPAVEIEAVRALTQIGGPEALAAAVGRVLTVPRDDKSYGAYLAALADSHSAALAEWLVSRLGEPEYQDARGRVMDILEALRGTETAAALADALAGAEDGSGLKDHAEALARRRDASETSLLGDILATSETVPLSAAAAAALVNIGNAAACVVLADLSESNSRNSGIAAAALASVRSPYGQEALLALASDRERQPSVRASAVRALAGHSGQRVQTVLVNLAQQVDDPDLAVEIENTLQALADNASEMSNSDEVAKRIGGEMWF